MRSAVAHRAVGGALAAALVAAALTVPLAGPASAATDGTLDQTLTGTLLVVQADGSAVDSLQYAIRTDDGAIVPVDPAGQQATFDAAQSGDSVVAVVQGDVDAAAQGDPAQVVAASVAPQVQATGGVTPLKLYVVADNDSSATGDVTLAQALTSVQHSLDYWDRDGQGVFATGTIAASATWNSSNVCSLDYWGLWNATDDLFPGVDFQSGLGNHLVVFTPSSCTKPYAGIATVGGGAATGGTVEIVGNLPAAVTHELGHNFGLGHSDLQYSNASNVWTTAAYYGTFGPMGPVIANEEPSSLDVAFQEKLNVTGAAAAVRTATADTSVTLTPSNASTGTRALKFVDPGTNEVYFVEYRAGTGSDVPSFYTGPYASGGLSQGGLPIYYNPGVRIYKHDGYAVTTQSQRQGSTVRTTFQAGQSFTPASGRFTVTVSSTNGSVAGVDLKFNGGITPPPAGPKASTTTATVTANPYGTASIVNVKVTATGATATGSVGVYSGATLLGTGALSATGTASISLSPTLAAGSYALTLKYAGDGSVAASTGSVSLAVRKSGSTTTLALAGSTATVAVSTETGVPASGTIEVYEGSTRLASGSVASPATLALPELAAGSHTLTAKYLGTANIAGSQASASLSTSKVATTTAATASDTTYGTAGGVDVTVTAADGRPVTGTVTVLNGTASMASGTLTAGSGRIKLPTTLAAGTYNLSVQYAGTAYLSPSSATVSLTVTAAASSLAPSTTTWKFGQPTPIKVPVTSATGGPATGKVGIYDAGGNLLGEANVLSGAANVNLPASTPVGTYALEARYSGNATIAPATTSVTAVVTAAKSTLSASIKSSVIGAAAIDVVVDVDTRILANQGTAEIWSGGVLLGSAPVVNGRALVSLANLPLGTYAWSAVFTGAPDIATGTFASTIALRVH
ncbi:Ig-like domain repeat protein [Cellulomonas sp. URHB0016]